MDQRRIVAFLTLSFLVLMLHSMIFPPPAPVKKVPPPGPVAPPAAPPAAPVRAPAAETVVSSPPPADPEAMAEVDLAYVTLGSVAEDSPYRLLVTFTNAGAAVRRIELSSSRYRDLHDRGGYLGHLELLADDSTGLLVQAVGAGTPAAAAGIQPGDRLFSLGVAEPLEPLESASQLHQQLAQWKPGQQIALAVQRGDQPPQTLSATLTRRPLEILRPESENVRLRTGTVPADYPNPPSFLYTLQQVGNRKIAAEASELAGVALRDARWRITSHDATSVTFRRTIPQYNLEAVKRYSLRPVPPSDQANPNYPGYGLQLDLELKNLAASDQQVVYRLDGPNGLPLEGWWYANKISRGWGAAGIRDIVAQYLGQKTVQFGPSEIVEGDLEPLQGKPLVYTGVDAQYFSAVLLPLKNSLEDHWIDETRRVLLSPPPPPSSAEVRYANVTCRLISQPQTIPAGQALRHSYEIFAGPKRPELLAQYQASGSPQHTLSELMYYGWFGAVAQAMLGILHFFYGLVGNYGMAIFLLTVLVRSCMFPISRKQAQSMARMQALRPEMDKLKEKYKSDMQKQSQAMQELYRKHGINPLAGCLPMFLQLPIFLGLYRALMVDVELRQAPLLGDSIRWCSNLAAPDMFLNWSSWVPDVISRGEGILGLGPYLNILPLATVGLFLVQQNMFMPPAADEQAAMQQKIMKFMMLFMGLLFFKVASGLCLYFIASSLWGIAERKMLPKPAPVPGVVVAKANPQAARGNQQGQTKQKGGKRGKKKKR